MNVTFDIETTNLDKGSAANPDNKLVCVAWHDTQMHFADVRDWSESNQANLFKHILSGADEVTLQNAKFEFSWLIRLGIDPTIVDCWDTYLVEKAIASNRHWPLDLGSICERYGLVGKEPMVDKAISSGVCPSQLPKWAIKNRVIMDVNATRKVREHQEHAQFDPLLARLKSMFAAVVAIMEHEGMCLDGELVYELYKADNEEYLELQRELADLSGGINWASPKQVSEFIYGELGFDVPDGAENRWGGRTDVHTMALLQPTTTKQTKVLDLMGQHSKLHKRVTTYHNKFVECVDSAEAGQPPIIYGKINQAVTNTQRLSSSAPNLQNIDRTLKKVFKPRTEGHSMLQADYAQLEFRVAAYLSQDQQAIEDINNQVDIHSISAGKLFSEYDSLALDNPKRSKLRTAAKAHTFKPLYGGTSGTKAEREYYAYFLERYDGIRSWQHELMSEAVNTGRLDIYGHTFYFPGTKWQTPRKRAFWDKREDKLVCTNHTQIKNYPVQYFATGLIAIAGTYLAYPIVREHGGLLINTVHDSILVEVCTDDAEELGEALKSTLTHGVRDYILNESGLDIYASWNDWLEVDIEINTNWSYDRR